MRGRRGRRQPHEPRVDRRRRVGTDPGGGPRAGGERAGPPVRVPGRLRPRARRAGHRGRAAPAGPDRQRGQRPLLQARPLPHDRRGAGAVHRRLRPGPRHALLHVPERAAPELRLAGVGADLGGLRAGVLPQRGGHELDGEREAPPRPGHRPVCRVDPPLPREGHFAVDLAAHERHALRPHHELLPQHDVLAHAPRPLAQAGLEAGRARQPARLRLLEAGGAHVDPLAREGADRPLGRRRRGARLDAHVGASHAREGARAGAPPHGDGAHGARLDGRGRAPARASRAARRARAVRPRVGARLRDGRRRLGEGGPRRPDRRELLLVQRLLRDAARALARAPGPRDGRARPRLPRDRRGVRLHARRAARHALRGLLRLGGRPVGERRARPLPLQPPLPGRGPARAHLREGARAGRRQEGRALLPRHLRRRRAPGRPRPPAAAARPLRRRRDRAGGGRAAARRHGGRGAGGPGALGRGDARRHAQRRAERGGACACAVCARHVPRAGCGRGGGDALHLPGRGDATRQERRRGPPGRGGGDGVDVVPA